MNGPAISYFKDLFGKSQFILYSLFIEKISFFIFFIIIARLFSADTYGFVISVFAFVNILIPLSDLGLPFYIHRETAADGAGLEAKISNSLSLKFYLFIPYFFVVAVYFYFTNAPSILPFIIISTAIYLFSINHLLYRILYAKNLYKTVFKFYLFGRGILLAVSVGGFLFGLSINFILLAVLISSGLEFILLLTNLLTQRNSFKIKLIPDFKILSDILKSSTPMGIGLFFVLIYDRIDILFIENILGAASAGIYAAAYSIYKLPHAVIGAVLTPVYTNFSKNFGENKFIQRKSFYNIFLFFVIGSILSGSIIYLFSEEIIFITFGNDFSQSGKVLQLLLFSLPFILLNNLTGVTLNSMRLEKKGFITVASGAAINIVIIIFIINRFGIYGAAAATIITEAFIFLFQYYFIIRSQNLK